jgi:hypothetical protein
MWREWRIGKNQLCDTWDSGRRPEGERRASRVPVDEDRFSGMVNQSSQILQFPFDCVGAGSTALSASATVVVVDRKVAAQFICQWYVELVVSQSAANNNQRATSARSFECYLGAVC